MNKKALNSAVGIILVFVGIVNLTSTPYEKVPPALVMITFSVNMVIGLVMTLWNILED